MASLSTSYYTTRIYTSSQLSQQHALVDELTELINESFLTQNNNPAIRAGLRLTQPGQLIEELGPSSLTAVCFSHAVNEPPTDAAQTQARERAIGTASIKPWTHSEPWGPVQSTESGMDSGDTETEKESVSVDGDFEISTVAVKPGVEFRGRGIAERLVDACEQAVLQKWVPGEQFAPQTQARSEVPRKSSPRPIRIMVKVVKEAVGLYWEKKGFITVGERRYKPGTWGFQTEFTMSAMVRELPVPVPVQ